MPIVLEEKNRKPKKSCTKCNKAVCNEHCSIVCFCCAEEYFNYVNNTFKNNYTISNKICDSLYKSYFSDLIAIVWNK